MDIAVAANMATVQRTIIVDEYKSALAETKVLTGKGNFSQNSSLATPKQRWKKWIPK